MLTANGGSTKQVVAISATSSSAIVTESCILRLSTG